MTAPRSRTLDAGSMRLLIATFAAALMAHAAEIEVRNTMRQYVAAWLAGEPAAVMRLLTDDSVLIPNEKKPYTGAKAIRDYWFPDGSAAVTLNTFDTTIDDLRTSGGLAVVRGTQVIEWTTNGERWKTHGNYVTVLRKLPSGWRIALQMAGNTPAKRVN